jgi:hypothetical protein
VRTRGASASAVAGGLVAGRGSLFLEYKYLLRLVSGSVMLSVVRLFFPGFLFRIRAWAGGSDET